MYVCTNQSRLYLNHLVHYMTVAQFNILLCTIGSNEHILPLRLKYVSIDQ